MATPELVRDRYIDELIGAATVLDSIESAAVAEAWASGAVAEWLALDGSPGRLAARIQENAPAAAELISWVEGGEPPERSGDWIGDVGRHEPTRAVQLRQSGADDAGVILEFEAPSGDRHDLSVSISSGQIVGIAIGPEGLAIAAAESDRDDVTVDGLEVSAAIEIVRAGLARPLGELSPAAEATLPLVMRRIGVGEVDLSSATRSVNRTLPERDADDDLYAADVVRSAMRSVLTDDAPSAAVAALERYIALIEGGEPDALTVFDIAGLDATQTVDLDRLIELVGAYLAPVDLSAHTDAQFNALIELEPADWVGVVLGVSRAAPGTDIDGDALVGFINKAPEITTTIPKADAPRLSWTFEQMLYSWEVTGVLTDEGAISEAAWWLLPRAAIAAWS